MRRRVSRTVLKAGETGRPVSPSQRCCVRLSRMTLLERCCWITKRPGPGNPHFEGLMDELVIYNRDLTAEELQELIKK